MTWNIEFFAMEKFFPMPVETRLLWYQHADFLFASGRRIVNQEHVHVRVCWLWITGYCSG